MTTEKKPSKKTRKPKQQALQPSAQTKPVGDPVTASNALIQKFAKAHVAFIRAFCNALQYAKEAGEALLKLQAKTGLKGTELFGRIRAEAQVDVSDRSCYLYQRIASRWNEIQVVAGDALSDTSLSQAVKLLQERKQVKHKDKSAPSGQTDAQPSGDTHLAILRPDDQANPSEPGDDLPATGHQDDPKDGSQGKGNQNQPEQPTIAPESASNAAPKMEGESDAKSQQAQEVEIEEPIHVQPPFDQPVKDRLAAVFAQNGPAPTPIQLMTNLVIPSLKKVAEGGVSENEVPFLVNAIKEALALIETVKQKYAIS